MPKGSVASRSKLKRIRLSSCVPAHENAILYGVLRDDSPGMQELKASIKENGIIQPLILTRDKRIVSGHRRQFAGLAVGQQFARYIELPVTWERLSADQRLQLLREHNRYRDKSLAEQLRESIVDADPEEAHRRLVEHRRKTLRVSGQHRDIGSHRRRPEISDAKKPMVEAVQEVVRGFRRHWPITLRHVHYALLNSPPLRHASKPNSTYRNDSASYEALTKLVNRMRLNDLIPREAIHDPTRPVTTWDVQRGPREFFTKELDSFLKGYYLDLLQSQPHHIELLVEKLTVKNIVDDVAQDYTMPVVVGRGYCSLPPMQAMVDRYEASGKDKLIVIAVTDHDPDGEEICNSFARGLRDDFDIFDVRIIKAAVTAEQVSRFSLKPSAEAKDTSANFKKFAEAHGTSAYELEALTPAQLQQILRDAIDSTIDTEAFNAEVDREKNHAARLDKFRQVAHEKLSELTADYDFEDQ